MKSVIVLVTLLTTVFGVELAEKEAVKTSYGQAVDVSAATSTHTFDCYRTYNYKTAFVRVYYYSEQYKNATFDPNGATNILNANSAGLGIEVYVTPVPTSWKQGKQQLDEAIANIVNNGITIRSVWLQVTSPVDWNQNTFGNTKFITSFLLRATQRGLGVGIYTSQYDWQQITGGWAGWSGLGAVSLWYWHVTGPGENGETTPNFSDFVPFNGFTQPVVKQYGQGVRLCSSYVNVNVYATSFKKQFLAAKQENKLGNGKIIVGQMLNNQ